MEKAGKGRYCNDHSRIKHTSLSLRLMATVASEPGRGRSLRSHKEGIGVVEACNRSETEKRGNKKIKERK